MSIKERKEITKMLVKVEVVILMMIFTIILLHTMPLAGTAMFSYYERSDFMKHYLKSKDDEIKYAVDMYCEHPNMKNNNTESIGCNGACSECKYGMATLSLKDFFKIMKYTKIDFIQ